MTDDRLFGETDLDEKIKELEKENKTLKEEINLLKFKNKMKKTKIKKRKRFTKQQLDELGGVEYLTNMKKELRTLDKASKKIGCSKTLVNYYLREKGTVWSEL